jgi:undecaprenyl pyrophosphate synthase
MRSAATNDDVYREFGHLFVNFARRDIPENPKSSLDLPADSRGRSARSLSIPILPHVAGVRSLRLIYIYSSEIGVQCITCFVRSSQKNQEMFG